MPTPLTPEEVELMEEKLDAGWKIADVAALLGRHYTVVSRRIKRKKSEGVKLAGRPWRCGECGGLSKTRECQVCKVRRQTGVKNAESLRELRNEAGRRNARKNGTIYSPSISMGRAPHRIG